MAVVNNRLRISFIVGALSKGGAEKQLIYMLRALKNLHINLQVITLTEGQFYEQSLESLEIRPVYVGKVNPAVRIMHIHQVLRAFRPHFIQASHFFTSLYAGLSGRLIGVPSIGAIRGDLFHDMQGVGRYGKLILHLPSVFLANSNNAFENGLKIGLDPERLFVLQNVIDLEGFDQQIAEHPPQYFYNDRIRAITVARLIPVKRLERFLQALAEARKKASNLEGVIIGGGPEEQNLKTIAQELGLQPNKEDGYMHFLGERADIPPLLRKSHIAVLTSDREGFPNVLLEAMAASIPVISTPAGEARDLIQEGRNGYLVPFDDYRVLANHLIRLVNDPGLRKSLGIQGRKIAELHYSFPHLEMELLSVYGRIARKMNRPEIIAILNNWAGEPGAERKFPLQGSEGERQQGSL